MGASGKARNPRSCRIRRSPDIQLARAMSTSRCEESHITPMKVAGTGELHVPCGAVVMSPTGDKPTCSTTPSAPRILAPHEVPTLEGEMGQVWNAVRIPVVSMLRAGRSQVHPVHAVYGGTPPHQYAMTGRDSAGRWPAWRLSGSLNCVTYGDHAVGYCSIRRSTDLVKKAYPSRGGDAKPPVSFGDSGVAP